MANFTGTETEVTLSELIYSFSACGIKRLRFMNDDDKQHIRQTATVV